MPGSSTIARRVAIAAATDSARKITQERREQLANQIEKAYGQTSDLITDWLRHNADADGRVRPEALGAFDLYVNVLLNRLQQQFTEILSQGLAEAASRASQVFGGGIDNVIRHVLQQLNDFVGADGLQLSDRIWRIEKVTHDAVVDAVRGAILRGASAYQSAQELIARGEAVPAELSLQIRAARDIAMGDQVENSLLKGTDNALFNATRVLRTEVNRAFTESFVASAFTHPEVAAVKFNLSPLHPRTDICDFYASANLHGLGDGVYPQNQHPYPAHPQTLSYLTVVFGDEISDADRSGKQTPFDWLHASPAATQDAVLGKNKGDAFRSGKLLPGELLAPWKQVQDRLGGTP